MNDDDTKIRLREYVEAILAEREKALTLTADNLERRLEHLNALRDEVVRDRATFVTRDYYEAKELASNAKINAVERMQSWMIGVGATLIAISGMVGILLGYLSK